MEFFNKLLKIEMIDGNTCEEVKKAIFEYIKLFYNGNRKNSTNSHSIYYNITDSAIKFIYIPKLI